MTANLARTLWLSVLALGIAAAPALAETAKPVPHHHAMHAASAKGKAAPHEATTEQLNAQSLSAAQAGKDFAPAVPAAPAAPPAK